jgi:regulator of replication initiation timing
LTKSQIAKRSIEAQQVAHVAELEEVNDRLHAELDAARSKLVEVEHHERALTVKNKGLKKDLESTHIVHDVMVKEKAEVQKAERTKLQRFQDSVHKKLAELRYDTEASVATLGGRSAEFPTGAFLSDFFEWFRAEVAAMPTAFAECNENINCYALIGVFQMLTGEGC